MDAVQLMARALCRLRFFGGGTVSVDQLVDEYWTQHVDQVRIVIAALAEAGYVVVSREPTVDMAVAGMIAAKKNAPGSPWIKLMEASDGAAVTYRAMIDAAPK